MKHKITVTFNDAEDASYFEKYFQRARETEGTISGLTAGLMCSALKRAEISATEAVPDYEFVDRSIADICYSAGLELERAARKLYGKLTVDEVNKFTQKGTAPMRLAKCLLCAVDGSIYTQFAAEATRKEIRKLRRIDNNRSY